MLVSVIVLGPSWEVGKVKVTVLLSVGSASSSREKPPVKPSVPFPGLVNPKIWTSLGPDALTIVIVAFLVVVKVQVTFSPSRRLIETVGTEADWLPPLGLVTVQT